MTHLGGQSQDLLKNKLMTTMYRELISWLGLFTSQKETLTFIAKRLTSQYHQGQSSQDKDGKHQQSVVSSASGTAKAKDREKKKDETIFGYFKGLVDPSGYYDDLL